MKFTHLLFICVLLCLSGPIHAANSFGLIKIGIGRLGKFQSQASDYNFYEQEAIRADGAESFFAGAEYWASWYLGVGAEFKKNGKRNTMMVAKGDVGGSAIYYDDMQGKMSDYLMLAEVLARYPFKGGRYALMAGYGLSRGKVSLEHQSPSIYVQSSEELNQRGNRWRLGTEIFFSKESGLRLFYAQHKLTWDQPTTFAITGKDVELDYNELGVEFLSLF